MSKPIRIQLSRQRGWRMPPNTVKVDRTTKWGNPFHVDDFMVAFDGLRKARELSQDAAVAAFRQMLVEGIIAPFNLADIREQLGGKNLACWCKPGQPCHADVLLEAANA